MSELAKRLDEQHAELLVRVRKIEESQRIQAAVLVLFTKCDDESKDKQRVVRMALGLE